MPDLLNIEHTIDTVNERTVPLLQQTLAGVIAQVQKAISETADRVIVETSNVINGTLMGANGSIDHAVSAVRDLLAEQDGWTATITIPPITIRLNKPKAGN